MQLHALAESAEPSSLSYVIQSTVSLKICSLHFWKESERLTFTFLFLQNWRGRQTAFDVAVTSPLSRSALPQSSKTAGAALASMKANKINKHSRACQANGIAFVPLVAETLGGWETDALFHLRAIAKQTAARSASQAPIAIRQFFQRLSVLLQRANAALIAARAPAQAPPHILGL